MKEIKNTRTHAIKILRSQELLLAILNWELVCQLLIPTKTSPIAFDILFVPHSRSVEVRSPNKSAGSRAFLARDRNLGKAVVGNA